MVGEERRGCPGWLRQVAGSIKVRTTVAAVGVVGVALLIGAVSMVVILRRTHEDQVRAAARLRAREVAAVLESGEAPGALAVDDEEEVIIQVVDRAGRVVASSPNMSGRLPVADVEPGETARVATTPIENEPSLVVAERARGPEGTLTILVARTVIDESADIVASFLWKAIPLVLLLVGVTTWRAAGRALAPVDAIRAEVDAISAAELSRRVPDPSGHDEIARLAATMNRMLARLEAAQSRQRRFVSDASHELRSPLAAIRQHAEVALAHPHRTSTAQLAKVVLDENVRVQQLVEDLLLLARADEGTLGLRRQPVDLDDLVFEAASRLRDATNLRIDTTAVSAVRVTGDEAQLRRMLRNLADNAARHAQAGITFALTATPSGTALLHLDDDGAGIPEGERQRVFERFVRLDDARSRDAGGSGLGLAIVAEILGIHGGTVTIGDSPLGGARAEVVLPAHED
jgi:signal transduction histidine kinase